MGTQRARRGMTLIELLIVMSVIGVLAAIVYPHFTSAKGNSEQTTLRTQLQTIRRQIELYKTQHDGQIPDLVTGWDSMVNPAPFNGKPIKPYLPKGVKNVLNNRMNVVNGDGSAPAGAPCGFVYHYAGGAGTGKILATRENGTTIWVE